MQQLRHVVVDWDRTPDLALATRALRAEVGHRSGVYLVLHRAHSPAAAETVDLDEIAKSPGLLYAGSATHLQTRLRTLVRALSGHVSPHGFGRHYSSIEPPLPLEALTLLVVGFDPGYSLEDWFLTRRLTSTGAWPLGNSRPARKTSRHGPRPWVKVTEEMTISRNVPWPAPKS